VANPLVSTIISILYQRFLLYYERNMYLPRSSPSVLHVPLAFTYYDFNLFGLLHEILIFQIVLFYVFVKPEIKTLNFNLNKVNNNTYSCAILLKCALF
jgi:hypothetical protein